MRNLKIYKIIIYKIFKNLKIIVNKYKIKLLIKFIKIWINRLKNKKNLKKLHIKKYKLKKYKLLIVI